MDNPRISSFVVIANLYRTPSVAGVCRPEAASWELGSRGFLMNSHPDSSVQRIMLETRFLRILGRHIYSSYTSTMKDGVKLSLRVKGDDDGVAREIFEKHIYEKTFAPQPGDIVVDAGANIGCFSLQAARRVGAAGRVFSFEPTRENFEMLRRNISLNNTKNIVPKRLALGDAENETEIGIYERSGDSSIFYSKRSPPKRTESVTVTTIDACKFDRLNFLKLDTEGYEMRILRGARITLDKFHPVIAGEAHPGFSESGEAILEYLEELGYTGTVENYHGPDLQLFYAWAT